MHNHNISWLYVTIIVIVKKVEEREGGRERKGRSGRGEKGGKKRRGEERRGREYIK